MSDNLPRWLEWGRELEAIARTGLTFTDGSFDKLRYERIRQLAAEIIASGGSVELGPLLSGFAADSGYATPKVDVRGVVFRNDELLLVKGKEDGGWTLPGGWADVGDTPAESVEREIFEEAGFQTRATKVLMVLDRDRQRHTPIIHATYKLFIRCEIVGGAPADSIETEGAAFFAEGAIPPLSLARTLPSQVTRIFEHLRNPARPTDFE